LNTRYGDFYRDYKGHRRYGLKYEDLLFEDTITMEALRRLPKSEQYSRFERLKVAIDLEIKGIELPREKWLKAEDDIPYLTPYINEVSREYEERKLWRI